jgi:hypothetical protein
MPRRVAKKRSKAGSLLIGGLLLSCASIAVLASDAPAPTFLESGSNDVIRFQKGEVPVPLVEAGEQGSLDRFLTDSLEEDQDSTDAPGSSEAIAPAATTDRLRASSGREENRAAPGKKRAEPTREAAPASEAKQEGRVKEDTAAGAERRGQSTGGLYPAPASAPEEAAKPLLQDIAPLDDTVAARLVTVCLSNPEDASGAKGFDIRRDGPPRYVADIGSTACARFEPTRHTLYLWKTNELGALSLILSSRLDLIDADGTQVSLDWLKDR